MKIKMKRDVLELLALDSLVLIICSIRMSDWLVIAQIFAAVMAGVYSIFRIYDLNKKSKNGEK